MRRYPALTREEHCQLGSALRRMHADIIGLRALLTRIGPIRSRPAEAASKMDRALGTIRSALDDLAVPLWPRDETGDAIAVYYGSAPKSPEIEQVVQRVCREER